MSGSARDVKDIELHVNGSSQKSDKEIERLKKDINRAHRITIFLGIVALIAIAAVIAILIQDSLDDDSSDDVPKTCGQSSGQGSSNRIILGEPNNPDPFHTVTVKEIERIRTFLKNVNILKVKPEEAQLNDSYVFSIDLQPPNKTTALNYLDNNGVAPARYARVVLFRGDLDPPVFEEQICGPLNNVEHCDVDLTAPFAYRPFSSIEEAGVDSFVETKIQNELGHIFRESFQASFDFKECEDDCLNYWAAQITSNNYGEPNVRKVWLTPTYDWTNFAVFPLDMSLLCNIDGVDPSKFSVEKVWYAGTFFDSLQDFKDAYAQGNISVIRRTYPTENDARFATLKQRGVPKPEEIRRPPELIEPDGKRYKINYQKVDYLDMWSFHFKMSPLYGLSLFDIRFLQERIIYELSVQELAVTYSGYNPQTRNQMFVDSHFGIGDKSKALVPGVDCPTTATFLPITVAAHEREEPAVFHRSVCVFEQNKEVPLRRHHGYSTGEGAAYGGMSDSALILRTIHTVDNYDYIVEFTFHQNGAIGTSVILSGYLAGNAWAAEESPYGSQIHDFLFGTIHVHLAHFKVDFDVGGSTSNQYETMEIKEETATLRGTNPPRDLSQVKFEYSLKETEAEALYKYNFDHPKLHIIHNNNTRNKYGVRKAYRIVNHSKVKLLLKEGMGPEPSVSWARYQMAVTKRKEEEQRSSNHMNQFDAINPQVSFLNFIKDNERIVDEDLVVWISLGNYHIPKSEDLPVVSTAGKSESFHILPYNYFPECPSMGSRDAVYIAKNDQDNSKERLTFDFYGTNDVTNSYLGGACTHRPFDMTKLWRDTPDDLFETTYNKGVD